MYVMRSYARNFLWALLGLQELIRPGACDAMRHADSSDVCFRKAVMILCSISPGTEFRSPFDTLLIIMSSGKVFASERFEYTPELMCMSIETYIYVIFFCVYYGGRRRSGRCHVHAAKDRRMIRYDGG